MEPELATLELRRDANGERQLYIGETALQLRNASIDVLLEVCRYPDGVAFSDLSKQVAGGRDHQISPTNMHSYLQEIASVLYQNCWEAVWRDEEVVSGQKPQRIIQAMAVISADPVHLPQSTSGRPKHWRQRAACLGEDTRAFFSDQCLEIIAKTCGHCVVKDECLEDALNYEKGYPNRIGVQGGLLSDQRAEIKRSDGVITPAEAAYIQYQRQANVSGQTIILGRGRPSKEKLAALEQQPQVTPANFEAPADRLSKFATGLNTMLDQEVATRMRPA